MNILDRYFLKEFLKPLGACLLAFLLCMVVYDLYDNIYDFIQAKTPFGKILYYYSVLIPAWLVQVMPMTLLLALLYVLSNMSKYGELTAMRASGLDFFRLMGAYWVVGICVSIQMLSINLAWAPKALYQAKVIFEKNTQKTQDTKSKSFGVTYRDIAGNRFWVIGMVDPVSRVARGIEITQSDESQHDIKRTSAAWGNYQDGYWTLQDVIIYDYTLPTSDPDSLRRVPVLVAPELVESPQQFITEFRKTKRMTTRELLESLHFSSRLSPKQRALFSTELHGRVAFPMANLVVFLIGIPFGVIGERRSNSLAIVNALLFFFAYMLVAQVLLVFGQSGRIPGWLAAWFPNILFATAGILMIRRIR